MQKVTATALLAVAAMVLGTVAPVNAGTISGRDPSGDSGDKAIDMTSYSLGVAARKLTVQVKLAGPVPPGEQAHLQVALDTNGDKKPDVYLTSTSPWRTGQAVDAKGRVLCRAVMSANAATVRAALPGSCAGNPLTLGANFELIGGEDERAWDRADVIGRQVTRALEAGSLKALPSRKGIRVSYSIDPHFSGKAGVLKAVLKRGQAPQILATTKIGQDGSGSFVVSKRVPPRAALTLTVGGVKAAQGRR